MLEDTRGCSTLVNISSETADIATAFTSVVSGTVAVWGFLNQNLAAAPIGLIVFTASLSYFFQRRMQENIRKYEKLKLAVTEALSPLFGEFQKICSIYKSNKIYNTIEVSESQVWQGISGSYRYYLVSEKMRTTLDEYFRRVSSFNNLAIYTKIQDIGYRAIAEIREPTLRGLWPRFMFRTANPHPFAGIHPNNFIYGTGFWRIDPTANLGELDHIVFDKLEGSNYPIRGKEAEDFKNKLIQKMIQESDREEAVVRARSDYPILEAKAQEILAMIESEITRWAG